MSAVATYSYTHSVTYVADNILKSLKDIIRLSELSPEKFANNWSSYLLAVRTWLDSGHLEKVVLEVYSPTTDKLIIRWEIAIQYSWASGGDGQFWTDTEQLRYAIKKAGVCPSSAEYDLILHTKPGRPDVHNWEKCEYRSTEGMVRQSIGSTVEHCGLGADTAYWRKS